MAYKLTKAEMETTIRWDAEGPDARIYTNDPAVIRKLNRLMAEYPETYRTKYKHEFGTSYLVNKKFIRFGKPASEARRLCAARMNSKLRNQRSTDAKNDSAPSDEQIPTPEAERCEGLQTKEERS